MATEIAIFKLKEGRRPDDASSPAGQILKDTLDTLIEQKGFQNAYFGRELENPDTFRLFVDWDSVDDHTKFTKTETYGPFLDRFGQIADLNDIQMYHTTYTPHPASEALSDHISPATEILTVYFPADYSESDQTKFVSDFKQLVSVIESSAKTYKASAGGWVKEQLTVPSDAANGAGEKSLAYAALIGWTSMEDHLAYRNTNEFKENIHLLRGAKDLYHVTVVHYSGTQVNKAPGGVGDLGELTAQEEILNPQAGGEKNPPKTASDGSTTKNNDDLKGAANSLKKERQGRGQ